MWAHHLWTIKFSLLMPSNILVQECTYFKINLMGLWYLVSVLSHLSLQKKIPHSWVQTFLVAQKWWQWYFEATISCIQREMTSSKHLTCKFLCVSWKSMWKSFKDSGRPCVGFSRPKLIWLSCLNIATDIQVFISYYSGCVKNREEKSKK